MKYYALKIICLFCYWLHSTIDSFLYNRLHIEPNTPFLGWYYKTLNALCGTGKNLYGEKL